MFSAVALSAVTPLRARPNRVNQAAAVLLLGVLCYMSVLLAMGAALETRIVLLRYWMLLAAAVFAVIPPHVLLPDPHVAQLQRLNRSPRGLLRHQLQRWLPIVGAAMVPGVLLALVDPAAPLADLGPKLTHLAAGVLVVGGTGIYAFERYATLGPRSQAWQEGRAGGTYRTMKQHASASGLLAVPDGLVPAVLATPRIFGLGIAMIIAAAYLSALNPLAVLLPGVLLCARAAQRLARHVPRYDRAFYATSAFYSEIFRSAGSARVADREPIPYDAVYWVPHAFRPAVWASLRQMDRRLPLGRFIIVGHVLLWVLFFQEAALDAIATYLVLFFLAKNGAVYVLTRAGMAPPAFHLSLQSPTRWIATRFFVNLRWTLSVLLSLLLVAFFDGSFSYLDALWWTALDVFFAFISALLITYGAEFTYRSRFA